MPNWLRPSGPVRRINFTGYPFWGGQRTAEGLEGQVRVSESEANFWLCEKVNKNDFVIALIFNALNASLLLSVWLNKYFPSNLTQCRYLIFHLFKEITLAVSCESTEGSSYCFLRAYLSYVSMNFSKQTCQNWGWKNEKLCSRMFQFQDIRGIRMSM